MERLLDGCRGMKDSRKYHRVYLVHFKHCLLLCVWFMLLTPSAPCTTTGTFTVCEGNYEELPSSEIPASVTELDVSKNRLAIIGQNTLSAFVSLRKLNISRNSITNIHDKAFFLLAVMETLDLSFNLLKEISDNILHNNAKLKWFSIAHNKDLKFIPQLQSKSLIKFNVSNCGIQDVNETTFQEVESIKVLDLSSNELTEIRHHTFDALPLLKVLDVSNNKLQNIHFIKSDCSLSLTYLDISSNNISALDLPTFQTLLTLRNIHFRNNPWRCNEDMKIVYEYMLKSEFILNLQCITALGERVSWHDWYYVINHNKTEETIDTCQINTTNVDTICATNTSDSVSHVQSSSSNSVCYILLSLSAILSLINVFVAAALVWILKHKFKTY